MAGNELALVPSAEPPTGPVPTAISEYNEPVAEHNFNRKKMSSLEQNLNSLQKAARQQHEVVSHLEHGMKAMISETDLRRAIGLAFQEFEHRLEDTFQDSNRKCLALFSKRDEVVELQGQIGKKVSWAEHNTVLKKLADLRQYIDTMAESVFIGHRDALNGEFAKKADAVTVDKLLKAKADFQDVSEVRARLERLEVLVSHLDVKQSNALEALREEINEKSKVELQSHLAMIRENEATIKATREGQAAFVEGLSGAQLALDNLHATTARLREDEAELRERQEATILPSLALTQEQLGHMNAAAAQMMQDLKTLGREAKDFRDASQQKFGELSAQGNASKEHVEFLMQATEMIKRRAKEAAKKTEQGLKEAAEEQENILQQLAAMERHVKRLERDVRAVEGRAGKAAALDDMSGGTLRALMPPEDAAADPNSRLKGVLDQLQKIADGGPPHERLGIPYHAERPPLPVSDVTARPGTDAEFAKLPRYNSSTDPAPIDSARGGYGPTASVRNMYGLSPRSAPTSSAKGGSLPAARKKR